MCSSYVNTYMLRDFIRGRKLGIEFSHTKLNPHLNVSMIKA